MKQKAVFIALGVFLGTVLTGLAACADPPPPSESPNLRTEDDTFNRTTPVDLGKLTQEIKAQVPDCVGVSQVGSKIVVHLKGKAPSATVGQMGQIITQHVPPAPKPPKPSADVYRQRYQAAQTTEEKLQLLAEWLDLN